MDRPRMHHALTTNCPVWLHARPCAMLVKAAMEFKAEIRIGDECRWANAKSMMDILTLAVAPDQTVRVMAEGEDAEEALDAMAGLFQTAFSDRPLADVRRGGFRQALKDDGELRTTMPNETKSKARRTAVTA